LYFVVDLGSERLFSEVKGFFDYFWRSVFSWKLLNRFHFFEQWTIVVDYYFWKIIA
jgi:hypothetical protein